MKKSPGCCKIKNLGKSINYRASQFTKRRGNMIKRKPNPKAYKPCPWCGKLRHNNHVRYCDQNPNRVMVVHRYNKDIPKETRTQKQKQSKTRQPRKSWLELAMDLMESENIYQIVIRHRPPQHGQDELLLTNTKWYDKQGKKYDPASQIEKAEKVH